MILDGMGFDWMEIGGDLHGGYEDHGKEASEMEKDEDPLRFMYLRKPGKNETDPPFLSEILFFFVDGRRRDGTILESRGEMDASAFGAW